MNEEKQRELEASLSCFSFGWLAGCCCFLYFDKEFRLDFVVVLREHREKPVSVCVEVEVKVEKKLFFTNRKYFFFSVVVVVVDCWPVLLLLLL